jgi:hypothetical protein
MIRKFCGTQKIDDRLSCRNDNAEARDHDIESFISRRYAGSIGIGDIAMVSKTSSLGTIPETTVPRAIYEAPEQKILFHDCSLSKLVQIRTTAADMS